MFPEPTNNVILVDDNTVQMPLWYWLKIAEFVSDVEYVYNVNNNVKQR